MKKNILTTLFGFSLLFTTINGCNDLDLVPLNSINESIYYKTEADFDGAIYASYSQIQQYWELKPKTIYQFYTNLLPRGNTYLRYTKSKKKSKIEKWAMDILCDYFQESSQNIEKTLDIMGKDVVYSIISKYGVDEKQLKKIWSK